MNRKQSIVPIDFIESLILNIRGQKVIIAADLARLYGVTTGALNHSSSLPYAFTEHGTIMAANLLNSAKAVDSSVFIVRAFVEIRQAAYMQKQTLRRLSELEKQSVVHGRNIKAQVEAINQLMSPPQPKRK
jgi:hypothetical protein